MPKLPNVKDVMTSIKLQLAAADHRGAVQADAGGFQQEVAGVGADQDHSQAGRGAGGGGRGAARHRGEEGQEEEEVSGEVCTGSDNDGDDVLDDGDDQVGEGRGQEAEGGEQGRDVRHPRGGHLRLARQGAAEGQQGEDQAREGAPQDRGGEMPSLKQTRAFLLIELVAGVPAAGDEAGAGGPAACQEGDHRQDEGGGGVQVGKPLISTVSLDLDNVCARFEGINPKFTKKLYEWESRRGIAPECSTITLLQVLGNFMN